MFCGPGATSAWSQVPDNRGLKLDPEDSVPPAYRDTLDRRDRQRLDAAREAGDSFMPVFQGRGAAPGAGPPAGALAAPRDAELAPTPPQPAYEPYRRPDSRPVPSEAQHGTADLIDVLIEAWSRSPEIVRVRYPPAADRDPDIASVRGAGGARQETPPAPPGSARAGASTRAPSMPSTPTIRVRCCWNCWSRRWPARSWRARSRWPASAWCCASPAWNTGGGALPSTPGPWASIAPAMASPARSTATISAACCCPRRCASRKAFLTALARPAESLRLGAGDVRYERSEVSTRDAVHAGLGTAARAVGDVLLENAPDRATVRIPRDTELIVVFATAPDTRAKTGSAGQRDGGGGG